MRYTKKFENFYNHYRPIQILFDDPIVFMGHENVYGIVAYHFPVDDHYVFTLLTAEYDPTKVVVKHDYTFMHVNPDDSEYDIQDKKSAFLMLSHLGNWHNWKVWDLDKLQSHCDEIKIQIAKNEFYIKDLIAYCETWTNCHILTSPNDAIVDYTLIVDGINIPYAIRKTIHAYLEIPISCQYTYILTQDNYGFPDITPKYGMDADYWLTIADKRYREVYD
jgi:hypothetical protein